MDNNVAFGLKGIEIINSVIKAPKESREISTFNFDIQFKSIANLKENIVSIVMDVIVKDTGDQMGQFSAVFNYGVDDLEKLATVREINQVEVPQPLLTTLLGISASTMRGLMFASFKGTFLHSAILPLIDIAALQPELAVSS